MCCFLCSENVICLAFVDILSVMNDIRMSLFCYCSFQHTYIYVYIYAYVDNIYICVCVYNNLYIYNCMYIYMYISFIISTKLNRSTDSNYFPTPPNSNTTIFA